MILNHIFPVIMLAVMIALYWHPQLNVATNIINMAHLAVSSFSTPLHLIEDHQHDLINDYRAKYRKIPLGWNTDLRSKESINLLTKKKDRQIPLHKYTPKHAKAAGAPAIIYFHGSGFVMLDPEFFEPVTTRLADETNSILFAVDYRKAPEHKFPAAIRDAMEVIEFVYEHADELGIDKSNIVVVGDSAGGNIASITASHMAPYLKAAVLVYPVTSFIGLTRSKYEHASAPLLTTLKMHWYIDRYMEHWSNATHPLACPTCNIGNPKLAHVPYMHIIGAQVDPLASEGVEYYMALKDAGVTSVTHTMYNNTIHGFFGVVYLPHGIAALLDAARWIKRVHGLPR